jgi:SAM-dependent methyltransferase
MFRPGTGHHLWEAMRLFPDTFLRPAERQALKPLGHAMVVHHASRAHPTRILEVGHGARSMTFDVLHESAECWGLDGPDVDGTVSATQLEKFRQAYPGVTFREGYLGEGVDLPDHYFDLVYSVSVIEHIPTAGQRSFHEELFRVLKPGGVQLHSYDTPFAGNVASMHEAVEAAGFAWLEPRVDPHTFWTSEEFRRALPRIVFEHPNVVLTIFSHKFPPEKRSLWNWITVFVGARKPQ